MKEKSKKFVNRSSDYSEIDRVRSILSPLLEKCNKMDDMREEERKYMIPNNNKKYYCLVLNKSELSMTDRQEGYKILYFFNLKEEYFFMEIDDTNKILNKNNYIFEGYLYEKEYRVTDILICDSSVMKLSYTLRLEFLNKIFCDKNLVYFSEMNCLISIKRADIFEMDTMDDRIDQMYMIYKNNSVIGEYINSMEMNKVNYIKGYSKENCMKRVTKGKMIDIYNVYDIETNKSDGILYVRTYDDSKELKEIFKQEEERKLLCIYNVKFMKWEKMKNK